MKNRTIKNFIGPTMAVLVFSLILGLGYVVGKNISYAYYEENKPEPDVLEVIKIEEYNIPINYVLKNGKRTVSQLCGKSTGLCDGEVGVMTLDRTDIPLYIYADFDLPVESAVNYFKIGERKISGFVYLDFFEVLDGKYLLVTEPNSKNDNYVIHIYNYKGNELVSYDATDINSPYEIKEKNLFFYYCNIADTFVNESGEILYNYTKYRVNFNNIVSKVVVSSDYQKCA